MNATGSEEKRSYSSEFKRQYDELNKIHMVAWF